MPRKYKPKGRSIDVNVCGSRASNGLAELSQVDVAELLGVSQQAVQSAEKKAIRKLRVGIEREAELAGVGVMTWLFGED